MTIRPVLLACVLMSVFVLVAVDSARHAEAREFKRSGSVTGPRGGVGQVNTSIQRQGFGNKTIQRNYLGPRGRTASSSSSRVVDRAAGTATKNFTRTGPRGQTVTGTRAVTKTDSGAQINRTLTGPGGKTRTGTTNVVKNPDGTVSRSTTGINAQGDNFSRESVTTRTDDGWTRTGTHTTGDGRTISIDAAGSKGEGVTRTQTWTAPDGTTKTRTIDTNPTGGGGFERNITGPGGQTRSWTYTPDQPQQVPAVTQ